VNTYKNGTIKGSLRVVFYNLERDHKPCFNLLYRRGGGIVGYCVLNHVVIDAKG
jgi:hypothetical protein